MQEYGSRQNRGMHDEYVEKKVDRLRFIGDLGVENRTQESESLLCMLASQYCRLEIFSISHQYDMFNALLHACMGRLSCQCERKVLTSTLSNTYYTFKTIYNS